MSTIDRRQLLRNALAALTLAGCGGGSRLAPSDKTQPVAATPTPPGNTGPRAKAVILLYMEGGPSQIDTWDPKPGSDGAGGVGAINTAVDGIAISQYLPKLAKQAERLAIIRSLTSKEGNHRRARHLMHTGYIPAGGVEHPSFGSIASSELGRRALPSYVSIGGAGAGAGFLGASHAPFTVIDPRKPVANLARDKRVSEKSANQRLELWRSLEAEFAKTHGSSVARSQREVGERAVAMMNAAEVVAFDLSKETSATRSAFGDDPFGVGCLMARRLVTAGVPFVEVTMRGWDTHRDHSERIKTLGATLDRGMSALLADLQSNGLLETTLVAWMGDFGRTPWLSPNGGRNHYPKVSSAVFAGGGIVGGQVIGKTDERGHEIVESPVAVPDLFRTLSDALGIDPKETRFSPSGRPLSTTDDGKVIKGLLREAG